MTIRRKYDHCSVAPFHCGSADILENIFQKHTGCKRPNGNQPKWKLIKRTPETSGDDKKGRTDKPSLGLKTREKERRVHSCENKYFIFKNFLFQFRTEIFTIAYVLLGPARVRNCAVFPSPVWSGKGSERLQRPLPTLALSHSVIFACTRFSHSIVRRTALTGAQQQVCTCICAFGMRKSERG